MTSVERTIFDLGDLAPVEELTNLIDEAAYHHELDLRELERIVERNPGRRARATVPIALDRYRHGSAGTKSELEAETLGIVLEVVTRAQLPPPEVNVRLDVPGGSPIQVDLFWRRQRLVVEVDGPGHDRPSAKRRDARRDARLAAAGIRVVRISHRLVKRDPAAVARMVRLALESA